MMRMPDDMNLPLFVYGIFKPGQLAYHNIKDYVKEFKEDSGMGSLKEKDGVPIFFPSNNGLQIKGYVIRFESNKINEAYEHLKQLEPEEIYEWKTLYTESGVTVNCLTGRREVRGERDLEHFTDWDGKYDPLFTYGLDEVSKIIDSVVEENEENYEKAKYIRLFRLQMAYMLLWSAIERYTAFRYSLGDKVKNRILKLADEPVFAEGLKKHVHVRRRIVGAIKSKALYLDATNPEWAINYYYQVRSNTVHRGKTLFGDIDTLEKSTQELLLIFRELLDESFKKISLK